MLKWQAGPGPTSWDKEPRYTIGTIVKEKERDLVKSEYFMIVEVQHCPDIHPDMDGWYEYTVICLEDGKISSNIDSTYFDMDTYMMG